MRNFAPLATIYRDKIVVLMILNVENDFQEDCRAYPFNKKNLLEIKKKSEPRPESNPTPSDRVARVYQAAPPNHGPAAVRSNI